jgi:putative cofactor-binding repeat protein
MPLMPLDRRALLTGSAVAAIVPAPAGAAPPVHGFDAVQFGVRPGAPDDQTARLQRAIDEAARARRPLTLAAGTYRAGGLRLPNGAQIFGVRGATRVTLTRRPSLMFADGGEDITLSGLAIDGANLPLPPNRGLVHLAQVKRLRVTDCTIANAGSNALALEGCDGIVDGNTFANAADNSLFCNDSRDLVIRGNILRGAGNGGIRIWQSTKRHDGSINVFRAAGVIVRNNVIRRCAFSAVRGNAASGVQILGNTCGAIGEVALYAEFDFEGAVISANTVDGAALGVVCTNFNAGGRLAVVQGNIIRRLTPRRPQGGPDAAGVGIAVEADASVSGNVIEDAPSMGISVGAGKYMRDVSVSGNVVRRAGLGIGVSIAPGAGSAVVTGNLVAECRSGGIVGMEWDKVASPDLARDAARYSQLTIANNQVR